MAYILPHTFIDDIKALKKEYEHSRQIDLAHAKAPFSFTRFFGATDVKARQEQIDFLLKVFDVLQDLLVAKPHANLSQKKWQQHVIALRILVSACLFVQDEIAKTYYIRQPRSKLSDLINKLLGITASNVIDENTRYVCLGTTKYWLNQLFPWGHDSLLTQLGLKIELSRFKNFEAFIINGIDAFIRSGQPHYPITEFITPIIARPFEVAGTTAGFMLGGVFSDLTLKDASFISAAILGGSMTGLVPAGLALLIVPPMTARLIRSIYTTSMSWMLGSLFRQVGVYAGSSIGMTCDMTIKFLSYIPATLNEWIVSSPIDYTQTGIRLIDGQCYLIGAFINQKETLIITEMPAIIDDLVLDWNQEETTTPHPTALSIAL